MKVKELIEKLQKLNPEHDVMIALKESRMFHEYKVEYECDITDARDSVCYTHKKILLNYGCSRLFY